MSPVHLIMFEHRIDPIFGQFAGFYLWWYGLSYTLGFLALLFWFHRSRVRMGLSSREAVSLTILVCLGVLIGGRLVEVAFYEWELYQKHLAFIPAYWLGGMSTHGILAGSVIAVYAFSRWRRIPFLKITDELAIPGAFIMGVGRLGNFADGQIIGAPADVWWAVVFPDTEGPRHPVVLYDGVKNLALVPFLIWLRAHFSKPGIVTAHFIFWYGFLRIFVDLFREYRVETFGLGPGQGFNIAMAALGLGLFIWVVSKQPSTDETRSELSFARDEKPRIWHLLALSAVILFPLIIPSDWTQDVPARYGDRHPGLNYSSIYPEIPERKPVK